MSATKKATVKDSYFDLVNRFPLVPIRHESHYGQAVAFLKKLALRGEDNLDTGESAYVDALSLFVEDYQNKHHQIAARNMSPLDALKYLIAESGMSTADLGRVLGNRSLASQILQGNRQLSKTNIIALAKHFAIDASLFLPA